eukprot:947325-Pleurochrysis_carterae.AAC.1
MLHCQQEQFQVTHWPALPRRARAGLRQRSRLQHKGILHNSTVHKYIIILFSEQSPEVQLILNSFVGDDWLAAGE